MTKRTRHLMVLVGAMAIVALSLAAIFPVFAQNGGSGSPIVLNDGDTLSVMLNHFTITEDQVPMLLQANRNLRLLPGQTVSFPIGVTIPGGGTTSTETPASSGGLATETPTSSLLATETPASGGALATETPASGGGLATETPATGSGLATETPSSSLLTTETPSSSTSSLLATETPTSSLLVTETATPTSGGALATSTPLAGTTPGSFTCAAGGVSAGQTYTTQAGDTLGTLLDMLGSGANSQLLDFVNLNCSLAFAGGQTVTVPAGIPMTGSQETTPASTATVVATEGSTQYTIKAGDTLESIAQQYGITVSELLKLNPNLLRPGQTINVPGEQGSIPQTGNQQPDLMVADGVTLGELISRYSLQQGDLRSFFNANRDLRLAEGQTIRGPQGLTFGDSQSGSENNQGQAGGVTETVTPTLVSGLETETPTPAAGGALATETATPLAGGDLATATPLAGSSQGSNTYITQSGDTLGMVLDRLGFDLAQSGTSQGGTTGLATATPTAATIIETATPDVGSGLATETATPAAGSGLATETATPAADGALATSTPIVGGELATATPLAGSGSTGQAGTDAQLQQFVTLNRGLRFSGNQTITLPSTIANQQGVGIPRTGAGVYTPPNLKIGLEDEKVGAGRAVYIVRGGDSLSSIARRYGTTIDDLMNMNPWLTDANILYSGQRLVVPAGGEFKPDQ